MLYAGLKSPKALSKQLIAAIIEVIQLKPLLLTYILPLGMALTPH